MTRLSLLSGSLVASLRSRSTGFFFCIRLKLWQHPARSDWIIIKIIKIKTVSFPLTINYYLYCKFFTDYVKQTQISVFEVSRMCQEFLILELRFSHFIDIIQTLSGLYIRYWDNSKRFEKREILKYHEKMYLTNNAICSWYVYF